MADILLTGGLTAIVDDEDAERVSRWKWHAQTTSGISYARRNTTRADRSTHSIYMHRVIMGEPQGLVIDHINGNGLDNRKENLRVATASQNLANGRNISRYTGVVWRPSAKKWRAVIDHNGRRLEIGGYDDRERAADARTFVATALRGEFAKFRNEDFDSLMIGPTVRRYLLSRAHGAS